MVSNSEYLDPEAFSAPSQMEQRFPFMSDRCYYCKVSDSASNWLIYNKVVNGWICEQCIDQEINQQGENK